MKYLTRLKKISWVKVILGVIVAVILVFVLDFLNQEPSKPEKTEEDKLQSVLVKQVSQEDLVLYIKYFGYIEDSIAYVGADRVQGRIKDLYVSKGQEVSKGTILFTLDVSSDLASADLQLKELENAEGTLDLEISHLSAEVNKLRSLHNEGLFPYNELEQAENQLKKMETQRKQLNEQHDLVNKTISVSVNQANVLSPIDGKIEEISIVPGTYIGQQDVIKIRKKKLPTCLIMVDESDIDHFVLNEKVSASIGDTVYEGSIKSIKSKDENSLLFPVEIEINTTDELLGGRTVKVMLETYKKQEAIMIPRLSLISFADETYVYVLNKDKTVSKKNVSIGKSHGQMVEITDGLKSDDSVLVEGQFSVSEGQRVKLIEQ